MALNVKFPKTCRNKKNNAEFLTPPDSSLSSSSGSLSSGINSERKQQSKRKTQRYKGQTTFSVAAFSRRKKLKSKKSSGSDSDGPLSLRNNNSPDELDRNSLFSSCKSFFLCLFSFNEKNLACALRPRECRCFQSIKSRFNDHHLSKLKINFNRFFLLLSLIMQQCHGSAWTSAVHSRNSCTLSLTTMSRKARTKRKSYGRFVTI